MFRTFITILHRHFCKWKKPAGKDTGITIFNPVVGDKVPLVLRNPNLSVWYTCGPTVYDSTHIGHASTYVRVDILQRILKKYFQINLITAMNVTDLDDKIINRAIHDDVPWIDIAKKYENEFWDDLNLLNVSPPDIKIRVSDSMDLVVRFVEKLLNHRYAYIAKDGSVYFRTKAFDRYGKLQRVSESNDDSARDTNKEYVNDFSLWKASKPNEPFWETPWGNGRPGWHIECSAMASFLFGNSVDFHAGGLDLKFPHHENEEAQSCCFHNTDQWVNYWIHTGQLKTSGDNVKMSKSLKNTISVRNMLKTCTSNEFRMLCLLSRYHGGIEFGNETTKVAKAVLQRILSFLMDAKAYVNGDKPTVNFDVHILDQLHQDTKSNIIECFKDDFNTPKVIERLLNLISETNRAMNTKDTSTMMECSNVVVIRDIHNFIEDSLENLGFQLNTPDVNHKDVFREEKLIQSLIDTREFIRDEAVKGKNQGLFGICDRIRLTLLENGVEIKDHGKNTSWKYKAK